MTMTQKRWLEVPILLMLIWLCQAVELSVLHMPYYLGTPQMISLIVAYIAFSRGWTSTVLLTFAFSFLGSANIGYPTGLYIAAHVWSALATLAIVAAFNLEGRSAFVLLVIGYGLFLKFLTWALLKFVGVNPTFSLFVGQFFSQTAIMAVIAWFMFPLFRRWDDYFLHATEDETLSQNTILK